VAALYPALNAARPGSVRVWPAQAEYHDIGTPLDYYQTSMAFAGREGTLPAGGSIPLGRRRDRRRRRVERCIVTDGARIPAGLDVDEPDHPPLDGALASG
jgi:hypothetical protein